VTERRKRASLLPGRPIRPRSYSAIPVRSGHLRRGDCRRRMCRVARHAVPVVVITGHDMPESCGRALRLGAKVCPRKPVDDEARLPAIGTALGAGSS